MASDWSFRRLTAEDWQRYRAVRLAMLLDEPAAYGSNFAREVAYDEQRWRSLLEQAVFLAEGSDGLPLGAATLLAKNPPPRPVRLIFQPAEEGGGGATGGVIAASLTWPSMFRAVRFRGRAVELTREEVAGYFDQRPYGSRLSAWASDQSAPIPDRAALEARWQAVLERFGPEPTDDGADAHGTVPVPDFWGGYRIVVDEVELWGGRRSRLHDRIVFERIGEASLDGTDAALDDAASWRRFRRQP